MKPVSTIVQLRNEFSKIKTTVAGDTAFGACALMFIAEQLSNQNKNNKNSIQQIFNPKPKSTKPTAYQLFLREGLQNGKTMQVISDEWKTKKSEIKPNRDVA